MNSVRLKIVLCIVMAAAALILIGKTQSAMTAMRIKHQLVDDAHLDNAPPMIAFTTVVLGGFRGILADILFLRLMSMQTQENYFEMVQLSRWIVELQPRFTGATAYLAWNMAYNISVTFSHPDDRWRWVQNGIVLIRDQALHVNPADPSLYRELGWLYQHKIAQSLDDAHSYYKAQLARQTARIFGADPDIDWGRLLDSPQNSNELKRLLGDTWSTIATILHSHDLTLDELELRFNANLPLSGELRAQLADVEALDLIERYLRIRYLDSVFKLDPNRIQRLLQQYGYLDFRLPDAHAIYWASVGLEFADNRSDIQCERMIFQSLKNAFHQGRIAYLPENGTIFVIPNLDLADAVCGGYESAIRNHPDNKTLRTGFQNFVIDAIVTLYMYGQKSKALQYMRWARQSDFLEDPLKFRRGLDEFVVGELAGDMDTLTMEKAQSIVQALVLQSYQSLAFGDYDRSTGFELLARRVHAIYMDEIAEGRDQRRRGLPEYDVTKKNVRVQFDKFHPKSLVERLEIELQQLRHDRP